MEQVLTAAVESPAMMATTALESTPPERKAPSGTSEIIRRRIDSSRRCGEFGAGVGIADRVVQREADIPVFAGLADWLATAQEQGVGGRQLSGLLEDGAWFGDVAEGEVFLDGAGVDIALEAAVGEQRLEFGAEEEGAVVEQGVEQRLDAEAVAGEEKRFAVAVPEGKGEHAAETVDAFFAPGFPGVDDDFGVAAGVEGVAERL